MRVVFLNRFFFPDNAPTGVLVSDVAFALRRYNTDVVAIASRARYGEDGPPLPKRETIHGVEIYRVWSSEGRQSGLLGRCLDYGVFFLAATWRLWRLARRGDIIVVKTDPPLLSVAVAAVAKLRGASAVNWLQDIFPEIAEALKVGGKPGGLAFRFLKPIRNWSLNKATMNVVVGAKMAGHLRHLGVPPKSTRVIPNWSDGRLIRPVRTAENALRKQWGLNGSFVVGYAGNLGRAHDVDTLLEAMTELNERSTATPPIVFVFVGSGAQHPRLKREVSRRKLSNVQIRPYQSTNRLAEVLGMADVHVVSLNPRLEGLIVPSKFYGIAAAGRPTLFIGGLDGEIPRLIDQTNSGFTIACGDAASLTSRILQLATDHKLCAAMGDRSRMAFEENWEKERAMSQWMGVLKAMTDGETELDTSGAQAPRSSLDRNVA